MWNLKNTKLVNKTKKKQIHRHREQNRGYRGRGKGVGEKKGYYVIMRNSV